ncbi:MAG: MaoC family dehydratase N-terminal domain-containing protein [Rhodospirillaceae bacterium]|nr:MaoC family dehydratase N-terminal domain-containing protein [Rhodospirillaceae bacterium]
MTTIDIDGLKSWVGRSRTIRDAIRPAHAQALIATLGRDDPPPQDGDPLPPLWHWTYFLQATPRAELGRDGHAKLGGFLPPVPLPRRMWAGGRLWFERPLRFGEQADCTSTIASVSAKEGRTGLLVFVLVRHEMVGAGGAAVVEEQDIVYREAVPSGAQPPGQPAPDDATFSRTVVPDPVLLFRYSALTFNGHRIHYDLRFCTEEEGYPGLVFHGPLTATLLADLARDHRPGQRMTQYRFRAVRPLFDTRPFRICGRDKDGAVALFAVDPDGFLAMEAHADFAPE